MTACFMGGTPTLCDPADKRGMQRLPARGEAGFSPTSEPEA
ncbi:hypothetical protein [Thermosporothrix hazakensis]|nr:hypothetical protein [Thermosporothrix hazakensis]